MGKLTNFLVAFDNPIAVYFPGQNVSGCVEVQLQEAMNMRGIRFRVVGRAYVHWTTSHSDSKGHRHATSHTAEEPYINYTVMMVGQPDSDTRVDLGPGCFRYPFNIQLPPNIPSSFEGETAITAYVRYTAEATIDKPWKFDHVTRSAFTVIGITDLNLQPIEFKQPFELNTDGEVSCLCWNGGKVTASLHLSKRCFVPGETINVNAEIVNNSKSNITAATLSLVQTNIFHAGGLTREATVDRATVQRNQPFGPGTTDIWKDVSLAIPALPPTMLGGGCKIIEVKYSVRMSISAKCTNVELPIEILIGSIPLRQQQQQQQPQQYGVITSESLQLSYPNPPTYEQCAGGQVSIKEASDSNYILGEMSWAPRYPYYAQPK